MHKVCGPKERGGAEMSVERERVSASRNESKEPVENKPDLEERMEP
jgi:hypothetical protein